MYKQLPILAVLTVTLCQGAAVGEDLDSFTKKIFGETLGSTEPSEPVTQPTQTANTLGPSTSVPRVATIDGVKVCKTLNGQDGECVPFHLCDTRIDKSYGSLQGAPCKNLIETCCPVTNKRPSENIPTLNPNEPARVGCGWANPKGVDMRTTVDFDGETKFGEFPWMVGILNIKPVNESDPDGQKLNVYVGGGSLIHPSVVLTAAHYVAVAKQLRVRAGDWDTQSTNEIYPYQERDVESKEIHKDFNKGNLFYDVALLFLSKSMDLAPNVGLACLPPSREKTPARTRCFATGWGKDQSGRYQVRLQKVEVPVVVKELCQEQLRKTRLGPQFILHSSFMCAGGEAGKDICTSDGGSPLSCPIEFETNRYQQSGIVSWGIGCGKDGTPGVYVDVANMREWIDDKVAGKGYDKTVYKY